MFYKCGTWTYERVCVCVLPVQPGLQGCWAWLLWSPPAADSDLCDSEHKHPSRRLWMEPQETEQTRRVDAECCDKLKDEGKSCLATHTMLRWDRTIQQNIQLSLKGAVCSFGEYVNEKRKIFLTDKLINKLSWCFHDWTHSSGPDSPLSSSSLFHHLINVVNIKIITLNFFY